MTKNRHINRELSWLKFNERVLQEADDKKVPLIDRLRFIGIFSNNLDEFFKVRYASVKRIVQNKIPLAGGYDAKKLLEEITKETIRLQNKSLAILETIRKELESERIFILNEKELLPEHTKFVKDYFVKKVSPALFIVLLDELKKFPELKDDNAYLAVKMTFEQTQKADNNLSSEVKNRYALIELPTTIDRFIVLPNSNDKQYIIMLDDLIRYCLKNIFSVFEYSSISAHMIKITRDAELDIDDDLSKSFISKISSGVEGRRNGEPVRLVYDQHIEGDTLKFLFDKMNIEATDSVIPGGRYHNRRDYMRFPSMNRPDLTHPECPPLPIEGLSLDDNFMRKISEKDYLLFAPYHDFSYLIRFLREAALDPKVKRIKITIYRLAKNSQVVNSLINAVKNGKEVTVQIELQARFDEQANIYYAEQMQAEGIKVIFGVRGLKVHSKVCVVEREENKEIKRYGFISTGNFNESTARIYTDYTLFTSNQNILKEITKVFNFFETPYKTSRYKYLIVSPYSKKLFIKLIEREIKNAKEGKLAYMKLKMNSLTSYKMIDKLYEASRAGVKIQMIVRGICCLIPGVKGMSENIEVISIVDKYLEHPRLYIFANNGNPSIYISSADWMTRNLDHRVEVTCPIYEEDIRKQLLDTFEIGWNDNVKARIITEKQDNAYRSEGDEKIRSQIATYDYYKNRLEK